VRVAAVDTGTNSTRLLVADVDGDHVETVVRRATVTRLGEGVDANRRLAPAAVERTHVVLADYAAEIEALGAERTLAVGKRPATAGSRACSPAKKRAS
jgi:exopolyphosphatase / guanosine-5'-triphosphate,3'-diphosphate pyrophosphatase